MLVISREVNEKIFLTLPDGQAIVITLVEIGRGQRARIGINAPREVTILREELLLAQQVARSGGAVPSG